MTQVNPIPNKAKEILKYWHALENFHPFNLNKVLEFNEHTYNLELDCSNTKLPWHNFEILTALNCDPNKAYAYHVYLGAFPMLEIKNSVEKSTKLEFIADWNDAQSLELNTCFARISLDRFGNIINHFQLSTLPLALDAIKSDSLDKLSVDKFDFYSLRFANFFLERFEKHGTVPLTAEDLKFYNKKLANLANWKPENYSFLGSIVIYEIPKKKKKEELESKESDFKRPKIDILNSFYLRDLEIMIDDANSLKSDSPLFKYLDLSEIEQLEKIDVSNESSKNEILNKTQAKLSPIGTWPAEEDHHMSLMQQLGINNYFNSASSLISVNGPPGTGKTTMLKEIIANVVCKRALNLTSFKDPFKAISNWILLSDGTQVPVLDTKLQSYEIVVASSNNLAVENISKELPLVEALGKNFQKKCSYFKPVAESLCINNFNSNSWGTIAAVLGNRKNRQKFRNGFFFIKPEERRKEIKEKYGDSVLTIFEYLRKHSITNLSLEDYKQKRVDFLKKHKKISKILNKQNIPEVNSNGINTSEFQVKCNWHSNELNNLRGELFVSALKLHEAWLKSIYSDQRIAKALIAISKLIAGTRDSNTKADLALWQLFFMIVPVVSTTFASIERLFSSLGPQSIGNLLIDEAGQALPQAGVGALWRAKKALIIGDPQQIEPIFNLPKKLVKYIADKTCSSQATGILWSPVNHSVQTLADKQSQFGTYISKNLDYKTWISSPLRIHRRCLDPMFSISNKIAYENFMIHMPNHSTSQAGSSSTISTWFHIEGSCSSKHWVENQSKVCFELIKKHIISERKLPRLFIISPFRNIRTKLKEKLTKERLFSYFDDLGVGAELPSKREIFYWKKNNVGTVHAFQGKEEKTVIMLLGGDANSAGAVNWASSKPNILNVALTRAKNRFYVIGDINIWGKVQYFSELKKSLNIVDMNEKIESQIPVLLK